MEQTCKELNIKLEKLRALKTDFDEVAAKLFVSPDPVVSQNAIEVEQVILAVISDIEKIIGDEFEQKAIRAMEDELEGDKSLADTVIKGLVGFDSKEAWELRQKLVADYNVENYLVLLSIAGCESDRAWKLRNDILDHGLRTDEIDVLGSLAGLDSDRAWEMRESLAKKATGASPICVSIIGIDSDRAWKIRDDLLVRKILQNEMLGYLSGLDSERAWKMREEEMNDRAPDYLNITESLVGLDSERAWKMREVLIRKLVDNGAIIRSLAGCESDRAWQYRDDSIGLPLANANIAKSLAGLDSERAWKMRSDLQKLGIHNMDLLFGINGDRYTSPRIICKNKK